MSCLSYHNNELIIEHTALLEIAAHYDTPCYVYSQTSLETNWAMFQRAFAAHPHRICYAVKANSNLALLKLLADLGSGFDIVSIGEANRVLAATGRPDRIVFSGVGKSTQEIKQAIALGIYCFNVESWSELIRINQLAGEQQRMVNIALRLNPNIDAHTHAHITTGHHENKFGILIPDALAIVKQLKTLPHIKLIGIASHIGSQITSLQPFHKLIDTLIQYYQLFQSEGIQLKHLNIGGGLGIRYQTESPPSIETYAQAILKKLGELPVELVLEPGRAMIADTGILLTRVEYIKQMGSKYFAIVDAGMNDLMRPALYDAWHPILPVTRRHEPELIYDIVGPVCESSDYLGKARSLAIREHDLLAIDYAGAYGYSMSSNYNSRCRPAEVLVSQQQSRLIRYRESIDHLMASDLPIA